jgi:hypothetical protein
MRNTLIPGAAVALLLSTTACDPATIGMAAAGMALDALTGSADAAAQAPNIMEALGGLDDQVSDSCLAKIDQLNGQEAPPKEVEISTRSADTAAGDDQAAQADPELQSEQVGDDMPQIKETATTTTLSSETEKTCRLQPVCLPGNSFPIEMMMCSEGPVVVADADAAPEPDIDTTPRETTWAWSEDDEIESAAP